MSPQQSTVTVHVVGGPNVSVPFAAGVNAQQALEAAYEALSKRAALTYALQYFGGTLGYLVIMINETYESFVSPAHRQPFYFWEFLVNGTPAQKGIDQTILNAGDTITFELKAYTPAIPAGSTLHAKYQDRTRAPTMPPK
jgi:hypothetical protein